MRFNVVHYNKMSIYTYTRRRIVFWNSGRFVRYGLPTSYTPLAIYTRGIRSLISIFSAGTEMELRQCDASRV